MYLKKQTKKNGAIYLSIMEKYHVPGIGSRERTVEPIGNLSELEDRYDDPIAHFRQRAKELTAAKKTEREQNIENMIIDMSATLESGTNDTRNVGYLPLKPLYKDLRLDKFWNWKTRGRKMKFSTDRIFRLLTFSGAMNPGSKRYTLNNKDFFFEPFDGFGLDDIYHALDVTIHA